MESFWVVWEDLGKPDNLGLRRPYVKKVVQTRYELKEITT